MLHRSHPHRSHPRRPPLRIDRRNPDPLWRQSRDRRSRRHGRTPRQWKSRRGSRRPRRRITCRLPRHRNLIRKRRQRRNPRHRFRWVGAHPSLTRGNGRSLHLRLRRPMVGNSFRHNHRRSQRAFRANGNGCPSSRRGRNLLRSRNRRPVTRRRPKGVLLRPITVRPRRTGCPLLLTRPRSSTEGAMRHVPVGVRPCTVRPAEG